MLTPPQFAAIRFRIELRKREMSAANVTALADYVPELLAHIDNLNAWIVAHAMQPSALTPEPDGSTIPPTEAP